MSQFGVSQPVRRVEDARFLRGEGRYVDDLVVDNQARAAFLRSPIAHGAIKSLDVSAARAAPGVIGVFTADDLEAIGGNKLGSGPLENRDGSRSATPVRPVFAKDKVRFVGDALAMVVAETLAQARDAVELIEFDIDDMPAVSDMPAALAEGAPLVHDEVAGNLCFDWGLGDESAVDAALAGADQVVRLELVNNRVISNPMETRGVIADWDAEKGRLHIETNTQGVWKIKDEASKRLGLDADAVHVTTSDVGGGFGTKSFPYPEHIATAFAARTLDRPVKWVADRGENILTDVMGRDHLTVAQAGFDADRRLIALKVETRAGMGAYLSMFGPFIPTTVASRVLPGVYDVQNVFYGVKGVFTNTTPVDAYRGAGRPESIYMIERLMDKAARELGEDPIALRKKSYIASAHMPYLTAVGETYDTGDFARVTDAALSNADWSGYAARKSASEAAGKLRGVGFCYYIESILGDPSETAKVELTDDEDGGQIVNLYVGTQSNGQGHETAYAQILHQRTGLPFDRVRIIQGDSDRIAQGGGTGGSRSVTVQGVAINAAADTLIEKLKPLAEEELEVGAADLEFVDGAYRIAGTDRSVDLLSLGARARASGRAELAVVEERTELPGRSYPNGCHIAEIEVDPETGAIEVVKYTMTDDFGLLINPMLAEGQAHGGVVQGIGQALTERVAYDETGQLLTGSFMDYGMPRADDAPMMVFHSEPVPSTANPIGMKGCGEAGTVGALAAVTNAALDALWPLGVRDVDMPMTPSKVWAMLDGVRGKVAAE